MVEADLAVVASEEAGLVVVDLAAADLADEVEVGVVVVAVMAADSMVVAAAARAEVSQPLRPPNANANATASPVQGQDPGDGRCSH